MKSEELYNLGIYSWRVKLETLVCKIDSWFHFLQKLSECSGFNRNEDIIFRKINPWDVMRGFEKHEGESEMWNRTGTTAL